MSDKAFKPMLHLPEKNAVFSIFKEITTNSVIFKPKNAQSPNKTKNYCLI